MHLLFATVPVPYPSWLNPADNTWQITAATFVGLMSLPALAVLYASIVQKKWAVNVLAMMFAGFSLVLVAWVLWSYKMGFGATSIGGGVRNGIQTQLSGVGMGEALLRELRRANPAASPAASVNRARRSRRPTPPSPSTSRPRRWPTSSSSSPPSRPLLFLGSVLGRIKFSAWCLLVPLWSTFVYGVDAFLLWGGGYFAQEGALDFSGGYVIHMSAGVSGFVAAWVLGPRLLRDRTARHTQQPCHGGCRSRHPVARLERLQRWGPVLRRGEHGCGRDQHQPRHRSRRPYLDGPGRLALQGEEAHLPRRRERHDLRPGRDHTLRGLGQRSGRHLRRPHRHHDRLGGLELPLQGAAFLARWTMPSESSTPTASPASQAACSSGIFGDPNMIEYGCGHLNAAGQVVNTSQSAYVAAHGACVPFSVSRPHVHRLRPTSCGSSSGPPCWSSSGRPW